MAFTLLLHNKKDLLLFLWKIILKKKDCKS